MQLITKFLQEIETMTTGYVYTGQSTLGEIAFWDWVCCDLRCQLLMPLVDYNSFRVIAELLWRKRFQIHA